jgi:hypothetical protein
MDKKIWILGLLGILAGLGLGVFRSMKNGAVAAKAAQDLFPAEKLNGYVQGTHIQVREDGKGGRPVVAVAVTPYGLKPEQVSPTGYGALKAIRRSFPKADWISVFIAEDSAMAEASEWVGVAEMRAGKVTVTGGIPSGRGLDSLSRPGAPVHRPTQADLKAVAALFDSTSGLSAERWDLSQALLGAGSGRIDKSHFLTLDLQTTSLHAAAKALGTDPKSLQSLALGVTAFYWAKAGDPL